MTNAATFALTAPHETLAKDIAALLGDGAFAYLDTQAETWAVTHIVGSDVYTLTLCHPGAIPGMFLNDQYLGGFGHIIHRDTAGTIAERFRYRVKVNQDAKSASTSADKEPTMLHPYTAEIPARDLTVDTPIALNGGGPTMAGHAITGFARVTSVTPDGDRIAVRYVGFNGAHIVHPDAVFVVAVRNPHCAGGMWCDCPHLTPCRGQLADLAHAKAVRRALAYTG